MNLPKGTQYIIFSFVVLFVALFWTPSIFASSEKAYQDYLYQFDLYRQKFNDFQISRNEYLKFKSLSAESIAIQKTREMLSQRSLLFKAYLFLLNEKIAESPSLTAQERDFYTGSIRTEVDFLETHSQFVSSVQTIQDAIKASQQLEGRYTVIQTIMRQTVLGLNLARLRVLAEDYNARMVEAKTLVEEARKEFPAERQATLDRWFNQIGNKRTLYNQKQETITQTISSMKGNSIKDLDQKFADTLKRITEAQQELKEGTSYMTELANAMKYQD